MLIEYQCIIDYIDQNNTNLFYSDILPILERILPDRLKFLVREVSQTIRLNMSDNSYLKYLHKNAKRLSDLYYYEYITDSLPHCIYSISNRIEVDIQRIINGRKLTTESPAVDEMEQDETVQEGVEPNPEDNIDVPPQNRI